MWCVRGMDVALSLAIAMDHHVIYASRRSRTSNRRPLNYRVSG